MSIGSKLLFPNAPTKRQSKDCCHESVLEGKLDPEFCTIYSAVGQQPDVFLITTLLACLSTAAG